jgi:hypothetical protein
MIVTAGPAKGVRFAGGPPAKLAGGPHPKFAMAPHGGGKLCRSKGACG